MARRIALGVLLMVAGVASALLLTVPRFLEIDDKIRAFPRTSLSEGSVTLQRGEYDVYLDVPAGTGQARWTLTLSDPAGAPLRLRQGGSTVTYSFSGREGERIGKVQITRPGRHLVRGTGPPDARLVFGRETLRGLGSAILLAIAAFVVLAGAGAILIIVALVRRRPRDAPQWP